MMHPSIRPRMAFCVNAELIHSQHDQRRPSRLCDGRPCARGGRGGGGALLFAGRVSRTCRPAPKPPSFPAALAGG